MSKVTNIRNPKKEENFFNNCATIKLSIIYKLHGSSSLGVVKMSSIFYYLRITSNCEHMWKIQSYISIKTTYFLSKWMTIMNTKGDSYLGHTGMSFKWLTRLSIQENFPRISFQDRFYSLFNAYLSRFCRCPSSMKHVFPSFPALFYIKEQIPENLEI